MGNELTTILNKVAAGPATQIDYLQFVLIISVAIGFGLILRLLYTFYFHDNEPQDGSLARGLVILTPALTAIFWMVQSSLTLSLGLLGSLSLIRFRTSVKRVEDVAFIVVMLAVSISLAVRAPAIAAVLLGVLFIYALIKNRAAVFFKGGNFAIITFNTRKFLSSDEILATLVKLDIAADFVSSRTYDGITSYVMSSRKVGRIMHDKIQKCLVELDGEAHINIFYPNERLGV